MGSKADLLQGFVGGFLQRLWQELGMNTTQAGLHSGGKPDGESGQYSETTTHISGSLLLHWSSYSFHAILWTLFAFSTFGFSNLPMGAGGIESKYINGFANKKRSEGNIVLNEAHHSINHAKLFQHSLCRFGVNASFADSIDSQWKKEGHWEIGTINIVCAWVYSYNLPIFAKYRIPVSHDKVNLAFVHTKPSGTKCETIKELFESDRIHFSDGMNQGIVGVASSDNKSHLYFVKSTLRAIRFLRDLQHAKSVFSVLSENTIDPRIHKDNITKNVNLANIITGGDRIINDLSAISRDDHLRAVTEEKNHSTARNSVLSIDTAGQKKDSEYVFVRIHLRPNAFMMSEGEEISYSCSSVDINITKDRYKWVHLSGKFCFFGLPMKINSGYL